MASDDGPLALWYGGGGVTPVHHRSILVVDDEAAIVRVLERVLTYPGCRVITAQDGQMALALAHARAPDLVITDIGLPALNYACVVPVSLH